MFEKPNPCIRCGSENIEVVYGATAFCRCKNCGLTGKSFSGKQFADKIDRMMAVDWWNEKPVQNLK